MPTNIITKMSIGETIYFIANKKVSENKIRGIKAEVTESKTEITYLCNNEDDARVHIKVNEPDAYISREDFIKNL